MAHSALPLQPVGIHQFLPCRVPAPARTAAVRPSLAISAATHLTLCLSHPKLPPDTRPCRCRTRSRSRSLCRKTSGVRFISRPARSCRAAARTRPRPRRASLGDRCVPLKGLSSSAVKRPATCAPMSCWKRGLFRPALHPPRLPSITPAVRSTLHFCMLSQVIGGVGPPKGVRVAP